VHVALWNDAGTHPKAYAKACQKKKTPSPSPSSPPPFYVDEKDNVGACQHVV
jgi:hypothetical protein